MNLLPPRVFGPLSECSTSVIFENAQPNATVILLRIRAGTTAEVGTVRATNSHGIVKLNPGEQLAAGDHVTVSQKADDGSTSDPQTDSVEVQRSEAKFNPPQVLTHLYQCSREFALGAMRPGTTVDILQGPSVIASGEAIDGTVFVRVVGTLGLPVAGTVLTARQHICPKPPPGGGATEWTVDTLLPPVEPLPIPVQSGTKVPAPTITDGLTACSRAVQVGNVIPGAEVIVEDADHAWWASMGPSDRTSFWLPLPAALVEGHDVDVRQEIGDRCEMPPDRKRQTVGPRATLGKPILAEIDCNTSPQVFASGLKMEADVEFEITFQGNTTTYPTIATHDKGAIPPENYTEALPAPPMPVGAVVRVRQGECDHWSDWSDPQTANALNTPVSPQLQIAADLFHCQNSVPIKNVTPLSGTLHVISDVLGEIGHEPALANIPTISVAPSLQQGHHITVEHRVCGVTVRSADKEVKGLADPSPGEIRGPLYDGDTVVTLTDVTAGAYIELWDQSRNLRLGNAYAPFDASGSGTGRVTFAFSGFGALQAGQHIYTKVWYCGHYGRNQGLPVEFRPPALNQLMPSSVVTGSGALTLIAKGSAFRSGALLRWWVDKSTTFISATRLRAAIAAADVASARTVSVDVVNSDGKQVGRPIHRYPTSTPCKPEDYRVQHQHVGRNGYGLPAEPYSLRACHRLGERSGR